MKKPKERTLRACKPNPGIRAAYRRKLEALIKEMHEDISSRLLDEYSSMENRIAQDWTWRTPAARLEDLLSGLITRWTQRFESAAMTLVSSFMRSVRKGVESNRVQALKEKGVGGIKFNKSRFKTGKYEALLLENVNLIRTIPQKYLSDVAYKVQQAVSNGLQRDELAKELAITYDVSYKRAKVIARDQTNKATQALARETDKELGITQGRWIHVPGRLTSRHTHIEMDGKIFELDKGLYDSEVKRNVLPGELILCFPGESKVDCPSFIEKLYRRWYDGELTKLVMDDGTVLSATPNHPILTDKGWMPAKLINVGNNIVKMKNERFIVGNFNSQNVIPTFDNLFKTFTGLGLSTSVSSSSFGDFHGDISNGDIDVIDVYAFLGDILDVKAIEAIRDFFFSRPDIDFSCPVFSFNGGLLEAFMRMTSSRIGKMCRLGDCLAFLLSRSQISVALSFCYASMMYALAYQACGDCFSGNTKKFSYPLLRPFFNRIKFSNSDIVKADPISFGSGILGDSKSSSSKVFRDAVCTKSDLGSNFSKCLPGLYQFGTVVDKAFTHYSGHVYNLQTLHGWYITQNAFVSNCQCEYAPVLPEKWGDTTK